MLNLLVNLESLVIGVFNNAAHQVFCIDIINMRIDLFSSDKHCENVTRLKK